MNFRTIYLCGLFVLLLPLSAIAQVATLYSAEGVVEAQLAGGSWQPISSGQVLNANDVIRTGAAARAALRFTDGYLVRLGQKSQIRVKAKDTDVSVESGKSFFFSREPKSIPSIRTPQVSASIRGTEFTVTVSDTETDIAVIDGLLLASNDQGSVEVAGGEAVNTRTGEAPQKRLLVDLADSVQWAAHYPAVLAVEDFADFLTGASSQQLEAVAALHEGDTTTALQLFAGNTWRDSFGKAIIAGTRGKVEESLNLLDAIASDSGSQQLLRISLLLSAGVTEGLDASFAAAEQSIAAAPADTQDRLSSALNAERALVALIGGNLPEAKELAAAAVNSPQPATAAFVVASYISQASNDLNGARDWLKKAELQSPSAYFVQARLAEVTLGFGDVAKSREYAARALALNAGDSYAQVVNGFAELSAYNTEEALSIFQNAVKSGSPQSMAYMGLGLAHIRAGALDAGRVLLEQAALLDPLVSLYRSYLGKTYYEQDNGRLAAREFENAIKLDPEDPTPYLYRAYNNLTEHKPIAAIQDIQASIKRNDNRAVFRSRLMLDQDAGTRSSGLGQIYQKVGFIELARVEAMKALQKDYANYSAHFLLGDLYANTHLNARAQTTENIVGRLLVPVTYNSSDLNIGGQPGLNEYTTLFDRPVERFDTRVGGNTALDSVRTQTSYTSVEEDLGYKIGYAFSYRGGFRENDWERNHQLFGQGQYQLSENGTLVMDQALTFNDNGDTIVNFDPQSENEELSRELDSYLARIGYRHEVGPRSHILAQVFYNYGEFDERDSANRTRASFLEVTRGGIPTLAEPLPISSITDQRFNFDQHLVRADLQYIWDSELVSVVTGVAGRYEEDKGDERSSILSVRERSLGFLPGTVLVSSDSVTQDDHRAYAYTTWHLLSWLDATAGLTYNKITLSENATDVPFVDETYSKDAWEPKVGLVAQLTPTTTFRTSYTESLDRTGRGGLGAIEPTFVGGFNQLFDGVPGSEQQLWSIGVDQTFTDEIFGGLYYQRRELDIRVPELRGGVSYASDTSIASELLVPNVIRGDAVIDRVGAYYYQILSDSFTGSIDYAWEFFEEASPFPSTDTVRVAPRLNYFHDCGLFAFGQGTFRYQERGGDLTPRNYNDFWVVDAGLGYEFDHRQGAVSLKLNNILDRQYSYSPVTDEGLLFPDFGAEVEVSFNF